MNHSEDLNSYGSLEDIDDSQFVMPQEYDSDSHNPQETLETIESQSLLQNPSNVEDRYTNKNYYRRVETSFNEPSNTEKLANFAFSIIFGVIVTMTIILLLINRFQSHSSIVSVSGTDDHSIILSEPTDDQLIMSETLNFTFYRHGYSPLSYFLQESSSSAASSILNYEFLKEFSMLIEPSSTTRLHLKNGDQSLYDYKYTVCPIVSTTVTDCVHADLLNDGSETTFSLNCKPFDQFKVTLSEFEIISGSVSRTTTGTAVCMYVRRDIEYLTSEDLNRTMDAMYTLWSTSDADGREKYGDTFHTASYFVQAHEFNSAQMDSDHMHEGIGFLLQHIKLTNMFETAIQTVDPSVSVPYWEFTRERANGKNIFQSFIFTPWTFGSLRPPVDKFWGWTYKNDSLESAAIQDGRWEKLKVDRNTKYPELKNSFGTIRGLWTLNPSPYVSRFTSYSPVLPSCSTYYDWLSLTDIGKFYWTANNAPHASTHGAIAATYGCDIMSEMTNNGYLKDREAQVDLCTQWGFYLKDLYRNNYITAKENCTVDSITTTIETSSLTNPKEMRTTTTTTSYSYLQENIHCGFICNDENYEEMPDYLESIFNSNWIPSKMTSNGWKAWRDFICDGNGFLIYFGDHLDPSVSPSDPSFWVIHPTQERLLHAKYMSGGFEDDTWPTDAKNDYVCSLAQCYENNIYDYHEECCYGHYESDQLLDWVTGNTSQGFGPSNYEILRDIDPKKTTYNMNYIYDNFDWEHCKNEREIEEEEDGDDGDDDDVGYSSHYYSSSTSSSTSITTKYVDDDDNLKKKDDDKLNNNEEDNEEEEEEKGDDDFDSGYDFEALIISLKNASMYFKSSSSSSTTTTNNNNIKTDK